MTHPPSHAVVVIDPGIDTDNLYKPYADGLRDDIFIKVGYVIMM